MFDPLTPQHLWNEHMSTVYVNVPSRTWLVNSGQMEAPSKCNCADIIIVGLDKQFKQLWLWLKLLHLLVLSLLQKIVASKPSLCNVHLLWCINPL